MTSLLLAVLLLGGLGALTLVLSDNVEVGVDGNVKINDMMDEETFTKITLEHSLDMASFSTRGVLTLAMNGAGDVRVVGLVDDGFREVDVDAFKALLDSNDLYRIRMRSSATDKTSPYVSAALPACDLQKSGFKEDISLHLDVAGDIVGLVYLSRTGSSAIERACDSARVPQNLQLQTRVKALAQAIAQSVPVIVQGPKPPYLKNVNLGDGDTEKPVKQQSFLMRYWYIIVPVAAFMLLGGGAAPDEKEGQGQAPAAAAPAS